MKSATQESTNEIYTESIAKESFGSNLKTYLLNPLSAGLAGFAAFFTLILITKFFGYIIGTHETFSLGVSDVIYSLTGFVCATGAKFLEFFGKED